MYMLVRSSRLVALAREEAPQFVLAIVSAESSFHFHSFSLECLALLGTWWSLSLVRSRVSALR
jgi:hypothetical protein